MPARSELMTGKETSTGTAMQQRKARLFRQASSGDIVPDIRTAGDVNHASRSRNARQTGERPFQSVLAENAVVIITNATWGDGSVRDQIAFEKGGLGTGRSKEPRGGRAGGPPDDELPAVSENENPEGNLIRAMIDTLKKEGVVHAMYEGDPREAGETEMAPIDFTTVSSADGNFRAFLSVRRTGNRAFGDILSLHWLDKEKGQAGDFSPSTGELSKLVFEGGSPHAVVITRIAEDATEGWEESGGAYEYPSLLKDRREMTPKEIQELIAKIASSQPNEELTEKAMEYLKSTRGAVKVVKSGVVTESELPRGDQHVAEAPPSELDTDFELETEIGAFYTAAPPDEPTPLTVKYHTWETTFQVPFTKRELAHLRMARKALNTKEFMLSAAQDSLVRSLLSYRSLPWGGALQDRASALEKIAYAYDGAENRAHTDLEPELADPIKEYMKYLVPFLPPVEETNPH